MSQTFTKYNEIMVTNDVANEKFLDWVKSI